MEHPFPPERIDWEEWACPGIFTLIAFVVLIWAIGSKPTARIVILCLLGAVTFWFLLMLPRFQGAREAAPRTMCRNNLHEIGVAIHTWHDEYERLPQPVFHEADGSAVSWRVRLSPYLGEAVLVAGYDESVPWDDAENLPVARRDPTPYRCWSNRRDPMDAQQRYFTAYTLLTGEGTPFPNGGPLSFDEISDGLGNTLLVGEACGARIVWTEPRDISVSAVDRLGINLPGAEPGTSAGTLSSYHDDGAFGLFADGMIQFLNEDIDPDVLRALLTPDSGDDASEF